MRSAAIICEYNPFHDGHRYHIAETRRVTGAECVIGIMSGEFVQRGEPAAEELSVRVRRAIDGGIDLLILLPYVYACSGAELFARGGCRIAESLGADFLSFGAETDDTDVLTRLAELLAFPTDEFTHGVQSFIDEGMPFAAARQRMAEETLGADVGGLLRLPNSILAVEYIKSLLIDGSRGVRSPEPVAIKRKAAGHGSTDDPCFSATAARKVMYARGNAPRFDSMTAQAVSLILRSSPETVELYGDSERGLGRRIIEEAGRGGTLSEIVGRVSSKHITEARIRRLVCNMLANESGAERDAAAAHTPFLRLLGTNGTGRAFLADYRGDEPVLSRGRDIYKFCAERGNPSFEIECRASDQYGILIGRPAGECYRFSPYIVN